MTNNNNNNSEEKPVPFLSDEVEAGVEYIKPNIETKLSVDKRQQCRDIVQEVRNFGINQRQLLYLIQLLSLELEDRDVMRALIEVVGENREKIPMSNLILK